MAKKKMTKDQMRDAAQVEYDKATAPALAEYYKAIAPAQAEYDKRLAEIDAMPDDEVDLTVEWAIKPLKSKGYDTTKRGTR